MALRLSLADQCAYVQAGGGIATGGPHGAVLFWLGVGLVIAFVLLAARATDHRARRRGHHLRSGGDMSNAALEQRRDTVASDGIGHLSSDRSWTAHSRGPEGRSPQTKDGA